MGLVFEGRLRSVFMYFHSFGVCFLWLLLCEGGFAMIIKIGYLHCYLLPDWVLAWKTRPSEEVGSKRPDGARSHESRFCLSVFVSNFVSSPAS